jgi:hypothetical protein
LPGVFPLLLLLLFFKEHNMKQCGLGESDNQTKQNKQNA